MDNKPIKIKCLEVTQPIGKFYIGTIGHKDLHHISFADVRRLETGTDEREVENYIGIQRPLQPKRVKELSQYVTLVDATFPTGIILSVSSNDVKYDSEKHEMVIEYRQNVAKVLDGQHRIAGLEKSTLKNDEFQLNVVIFVEMELEDQAIVFATINKTQTKVNKSLVIDLFDFATTRSPQKTAHNIARALNEQEGSPFYQKIKILGVAEDSQKETITQATFVENLLRYMTTDPMTDRDLYKRGKKPDKVSGNEQQKLFFRNWFINEQDDKIAKVLWNYFGAVSDRWPQAWKPVTVDVILNKSTGFIALMRFLKDAYTSLGRVGEIAEQDEFKNIFDKIKIVDSDFNKQQYVPGGIGQSKLLQDFLRQSGLKK